MTDDSAVTTQPSELTVVQPAPKPERKRTKPPVRQIPSDSFVVTMGDEKYYPHVGEWVEFVPVVQLDTLLTAMTLQGLQDVDMGNVTTDDATTVRTAFNSVTEDLSRAIVRWNWTDNEDKPYPEHPGKDDLRRLSLDEIMWLVGASFGGRSSEDGEDRGEGSPG